MFILLTYIFFFYQQQKHIGPKNFFFKRNKFVYSLTKTTLGVIIITRNDKANHRLFILICH